MSTLVVIMHAYNAVYCKLKYNICYIYIPEGSYLVSDSYLSLPIMC